MNQKYLDEVRARYETATPIPDFDGYYVNSDGYVEGRRGSVVKKGNRARQDIPALLAEVERLQSELNAFKQSQLYTKQQTTCPNCDGRGVTYHVRACAEDDSTGWYQCHECQGTGKVTKMVPLKNGQPTASVPGSGRARKGEKE